MGAGTSLPGALLPEFIDQFGLSPLGAGTILAMSSIGYLASVLSTPRILSRRGVRATARDGLIVYAVSSILIGLAPQAWMVGGALLALGLGFGAIDVSTNALFAARSGPRTTNVLNLIHFFFGIGAFALPALAAAVLASTWGWPLLCFLLAATSAAAGFGWQGLPPDATTLQSPPVASTPTDGIVSGSVRLLALVLGLYVGAEVGLGSWIGEYMVAIRSVPVEPSAATLSAYWLGLAVGRLLLSAVAHRVEDRTLLLLSAAASVATLWAALEMADAMGAAACFFATGMAFAGIFPTVIALAGRAHPTDVARATSAVIAMSAVGGITIPWLMSLISEQYGIEGGMCFYVWIVSAMVAVILAAIRKPQTLASNIARE